MSLKEFSDKIHMNMASPELIREKALPTTAVWQSGADQRPSNVFASEPPGGLVKTRMAGFCPSF